MQMVRSFLEKYLSTFFFFIALLFYGEEVGLYHSPVNKLCGSFFLFLYLLAIYKNLSEQARRFAGKSGLALALVLILVYVFTLSSPFPMISVGLALLVPLGFNQQERKTDFLVGLVLYIYILLKTFVPQFCILEGCMADNFNSLINTTTGLPINYSPYTYGFGGFVLLFTFSSLSSLKTRFFLGSKRSRLYCVILPLVFVCSYFIMQIFYFIATERYYSLIPPTTVGKGSFLYYSLGFFFPMSGQGIIFSILFLIILVTHFFLTKGEPSDADTEVSRERRLHFISVIIMFTVILAALYWNLNIYNSDQPKSNIYIWDTGMDFDTVPNDKVFGRSNGMFAMVCHYLRDWGYEVSFGKDWRNLEPERHDVLFLLNPHGSLDVQKKNKLLSFMKKGGRLLICGDHTFMFGLKNDYFSFCRELGIAFNFDTAIYFRSFWRNSLWSPNPTWNSLVQKDGFTTNILMGASLNPSYPAAPLILGRYGWSDRGDINNKDGYLGDQIFSVSERTGELILAAERNYGKGKLVIFGDTTFLQNTPISTSYPLLRLCLAHIQPREWSFKWMAVPVFFLLISVLVILVNKVYRIGSLTSVISIVLCVFIFFVFFAYQVSTEQAEKCFMLLPKAKQTRAGINCSHYPGYYQNDWGRPNRGLGGLKNNLIRKKILPYSLYKRGFSQLDRVDYLFILEPHQKFSMQESKKIREFIRSGGTLICAVGFEHREAIRPLLNLLKVDLAETPLSYLKGKDTDLGLRFISAWPVMSMIKSNEFDLLCTAWGRYPVIVSFPEGKGRVVIIGDSHFFENRNLEMESRYYKNNIDFLQFILNEATH